MIKKELQNIMKFMRKLTCWLFGWHDWRPLGLKAKGTWRWWYCEKCGKIVDIKEVDFIEVKEDLKNEEN